ncbi:MAG: ATP-dependent 6-phosphofructokinase [Mycoplasmoidaceae bacterium]
MKNFAILTSGGDSSSMNKVITTFVRTCEHYGIKAFLIYDGFKGLVEGKIIPTNFQEVKNWYNLAGTKIHTSRFPELKEDKKQLEAAEQLKNHQIDGLIVCGGDGSFMGAYKLMLKGVKVNVIPGTIDNDTASSDISLGYCSSLEYIVTAIEAIKSTMESHHFVSIIEVMGRHCPDLAIFAGIATEADYVITSENFKSPEEIGHIIKKIRVNNSNSSIIIIVAEYIYGKNGVPNLEETSIIASKICGEKIRCNVIGYAQRAPKPSAVDLINATLLTTKAIELLNDNRFHYAIGFKGNDIIETNLEKAVNLKKRKRINLISKYINFNNL